LSIEPGDLVSVVVFALILSGAFLRVFAWQTVKRLLAGGWPTTQGRIEFHSVVPYRTRYKDFYIARLDYSYSVNSEYYSGYFEKAFVMERSADKFVASMNEQMLFIRYKSERPEKSALFVQDQPSWPT
jgi:hypothetical protein